MSSRLTVLPAGRPDPDPMSVLTSSRMQYVLDEAREKFDWVIVDTPPVGLMPDAHLLAAMVDGAVLIVGAGMSPHRTVAKAAEVIGRDRILGVVLNRVQDTDTSHDGYYYSSYYGSGTTAETLMFIPEVALTGAHRARWSASRRRSSRCAVAAGGVAAARWRCAWLLFRRRARLAEDAVRRGGVPAMPVLLGSVRLPHRVRSARAVRPPDPGARRDQRHSGGHLFLVPAADHRPRRVHLSAGVVLVSLVTGWRVAFEWITRTLGPRERLLLVGTGAGAVELARELHRAAPHARRARSSDSSIPIRHKSAGRCSTRA